MTTWIFQGNPETFDIDGYLAASSGMITWLAPQSTAEMMIGDTAFIWRSAGDGKQPSGIVAAGTLVEQPAIQLDDPISKPFWKEGGGQPAMRVRIRLNRVASVKEVLKRDWMKDDSALTNMLIMRRAAGTVFKVQSGEATRLEQLWQKTGTDWARDEVVAALWLYNRLYRVSISKSAGSEVEKLAQKIGRAVTGVYNKLMNFRSIDPRDERKGFEGGSKIDQRVWDEFYSGMAAELDTSRLDAEYRRLWGEATSAPRVTDTVDEDEERRLSKKPLAWLLDQYASRPKNLAPKRRSQETLSFERDPLVVTLRKQLSGYQCEVEGCGSERFKTEVGEYFIEVHHLVPLSESGPDILENTVCLCPTHHRYIHHSSTRAELQQALKQKRKMEAGN